MQELQYPFFIKKTEKEQFMATQGIKLKIELNGSSPLIFRTLCVSDKIHLGQLHSVIQTAMGWFDSHLHQFCHQHQFIGKQDESGFSFGPEVADETTFTVDDVLPKKGSKITYEYDFGDSWEHTVTSLGTMQENEALYTILEGQGACPPEDCGGIYGYYDMVKKIDDPNDPEHAEIIEWAEEMGYEDFKPEDFNIKRLNAGLILARTRGTFD